MEFLDSSPVNFLACARVRETLEAAGFREFDPSRQWTITPGTRGYVVKNGSAVFAFIAGSDPAAGFRIISSHSDSPGFRIKPHPEMLTEGGILKLNTEVYGGPDRKSVV